MALMVQCVNHATQVSECYGDVSTVIEGDTHLAALDLLSRMARSATRLPIE